MGVICQRHKMFSEAIEAYKQSLRLNPSDDETRYNLALCKHQQKKQQGGQNQQQQNDDKGNDKDKKDQNKDQQKKDQQDQQKPKEPEKPKMSKDNAEQLLNAAIQNEKATQERMKKAQQQPQKRNVEKNW